MINKKTIETISLTAKIEEVVGDFVHLKKRGVNLLGLCPFHSEKSPSFNVNPTRNIFKCFGCGEGGDAVAFVMKHEQMTYPEALRYLAAKYRIEIEEDFGDRSLEEVKAEQSRLERLHAANDFAARFYAAQLFDTELGKSIGLSYFKERGYREDVIRKFGLGYAPAGGKVLTTAAMQSGHERETLQAVGLTNQGGYDFFRDRVLFPIVGITGKTLGFGGRILIKDKTQPKYINTGETEIYVKSKVLFGIFPAKNAIRKLDECYLVEGYTDVVSLHQAGIENVVASGGTALTEGQLLLIKRLTPNLTILYDGDAAGIKAALRGTDLALELGLNVRIVVLPEGEDPDSYVGKVGAAAMKTYIEKERKDFILFKTSRLHEEAQADPIQRAGLVKEIVQTIAKIKEPIQRSMYIKSCATVLNVEELLLAREVATLIRTQHLKGQAPAQQTQVAAALTIEDKPALPSVPSLSPDEPTEQDVARLLILFGNRLFDQELSVAEYMLLLMEELTHEMIHEPSKSIVQEYLMKLHEGYTLPTDHFLHHENDAIRRFTAGLIVEEHQLSPGWEKRDIYLETQPMPSLNHVKDVQDGVFKFMERKLSGLLEKAVAELKSLPQDHETEKQALITRIMDLQKQRNEFARTFRRVVE